MKALKIALIHEKLAFGGGMETYFLELIRGYAAFGHAIEVFVMRSDASIPLPSQVKVTVLSNRLRPRFLSKLYFAWKLKRFLKAQTFDLIISLAPTFYQDILITGGTHKGYTQALRRYYPRDLIQNWMEQKAYESSKKVLAHSPQIAQDLKDLYRLPASSIAMLYPPVDVSQFQFQEKKKRPGLPILRLLFVSTSHKRKGGFLLLEALKKLPPEHFTLTVLGRPFPAAHRIPRLQVQDMGYVSDIAPYYHQADLLVLPSYFEPFGLVVVQALECGTPVLVSKAVGAACLVKSGEGLILERQQADALAALLRQARESTFSVQPGFAEGHGLTLNQHLLALLKIGKQSR